jgi:hypothetical protein
MKLEKSVHRSWWETKTIRSGQTREPAFLPVSARPAAAKTAAAEASKASAT